MVEVLVNWVGLPLHTVVAVKLAVGLGYTTTWVVALLLWPFNEIVQVYVPAIAMVQLGRVGFC